MTSSNTEPRRCLKPVQDGFNFDYTTLTESLRANQPGAIQEFERVFAGGIAFFLERAGVPKQNQGLLAKECYARVQGQIKTNPSFLPSHLPRFIISTVRLIASTHGASPEELFSLANSPDKAPSTLSFLSNQGKDALTSYYVEGQSVAQVCNQFGISERRFKHYKAQAKSMFLRRRQSQRDQIDAA